MDRRVAMALLALLGIGAGWEARALLEPRVVLATAPSATSSGTRPGEAGAAPPTSERMREAFEDIYRGAVWGTNADDAGHSGVGSTMRTTLLYRTFLAQFMKDTAVHSVVDAGCGDWEFSRAIDWSGIDYKGFDIAPRVIKADQERFTRPNVHFFVGDIVDDDLPPADLLIVKHVLQHLPNAAVEKFLRQLPKYRHALLIDGVNAEGLSSTNPDIPVGGYRPLDVTKPPFNVRGAKLLTYWDGAYMEQVVYVSSGERTPIPQDD